MELKLDRTTQNLYELSLGDHVLAQSTELEEVLMRGQKLAKKYAKNLFITKAAASDWYVGFPEDKDQNPEIFFDPVFQLRVEAAHGFRFLEGPFLNAEEAQEACFRISGKTAHIKDDQ